MHGKFNCIAVAFSKDTTKYLYHLECSLEIHYTNTNTFNFHRLTITDAMFKQISQNLNHSLNTAIHSNYHIFISQNRTFRFYIFKTIIINFLRISSLGGLEVEQWSDNRTLSFSVDQSPCVEVPRSQ